MSPLGRACPLLPAYLVAAAFFCTRAPLAQDNADFELRYGSRVVKHDEERGDDTYLVFGGYFEFRAGSLRVRADSAVIVVDRDSYQKSLVSAAAGEALPHRPALPPSIGAGGPESRVEARLRERAKAISGGELRLPAERLAGLRLLLHARHLYAEGNVLFEERGIRNLRCKRLFLSLVSDRGFMEDVELRLPVGTAHAAGGRTFTLRSPRVVQQGDRIIAEKAGLTACDAGEPHYEVRSDRLVIARHDAVVEFAGLGNSLAIEGFPTVPLPDYRWYSDQENWIPLRGASAGRSTDRGAFGLLEFGGRWNDLGQGIVDAIVPDSGLFHGEWSLRTGITERRGVPVEPRVDYRLPGVFEGWVEGFVLDDEGRDRRSVRARLDGSPVERGTRSWVRSRNRVRLGEATRLDLELFTSADPGAYAEFRDRTLKGEEAPETSAHLRHARGNLRASLTGRWTLDDYAYDERATLREKFASERPIGRVDLFSQPVFELADLWPVVLDTGVSAGLLRNQFEGTAPGARRERSWRADGFVELSAPRRFGPYAFRPFFRARETSYSELESGRAGTRKVWEAGASLSTVFSAELASGSVRHEIRPEVIASSRFGVDREPGDYLQFDEVDALDEVSVVDIRVLQRVTRVGAKHDVLWLDLVQRLHPNAGRDNAGERLGLFEFEAELRPGLDAIPGLRVFFEGERDWDRGDFKSRNVGLAVGPRELNASAEWRSGRDADGFGIVAFNTEPFGRWSVSFGALYNFELSETSSFFVSLVRHDHDWRWQLSVAEDQNTGDRSFVLRFDPGI